MKVILPRIETKWVDEILVIDGNSTDGSYEYAQEFEKKFGWKLIRQKSKGLADAYREALEVITNDVVIPFSPDGNSIPERIPELVAKMKEGYDMVIVSRYLNGAKSEDDTWFTGFGNWLITMMINILFGGHYTDSLVMFRAWKKTLVEDYAVDFSAAGFEPQLAILCAKGKFKVAEIPGDEPKRIHGDRKTNAVIGGFSIMKLIFKELFVPVLHKNRNLEGNQLKNAV